MPDQPPPIATAIAHFRRSAYYIADNPYLRASATTELLESESASLQGLLRGDISARDWLSTTDGIRALDAINVGCVPRDLQLVLKDNVEQVGVESVHGFADVPPFWWIISFMWCAEVGRTLDAELPETIFAHRLSPKFRIDPSSSGQIFEHLGNSIAEWKKFPGRVTADHAGETLALATVDLRAFYYSVNSLPSQIIQQFTETAQLGESVSALGKELTALLDAAHRRYAEQNLRINPRGEANDSSRPLPIGLPSSQILGNLVVSMAILKLHDLANVVAVGAYADDIVLMTPTLPNVGESAQSFLERIAVVKAVGDHQHILSLPPRMLKIATFVVRLEKSTLSYGRKERLDNTSEAGTSTIEFDIQMGSTPGTDWGGRLQTILHSPFKRDRVPRQLRNDLIRLVDDIRVGLDQNDAQPRLDALLADLDQGSFLSLRSSWPQLIACASFVGGPPLINLICNRLTRSIEILEQPSSASMELAGAIRAGIRASWAQAMTEALALADRAGEEIIEQLDERLVESSTGQTKSYILAKATHLREICFVGDLFISLPLAEFMTPPRQLFGITSPPRESTVDARELEQITNRLSLAPRFIPLHEICVAVHLWIAPADPSWLQITLRIFRAQPLLNAGLAEELSERISQILGLIPSQSQRTDMLRDYYIRFAVPSMEVCGDQLRALIDLDKSALSRIARTSRRNITYVVESAVKRKADALILPEWAVLAPQLHWMFSQSGKAQMLLVAGEAPAIRHGQYSNRVWTGIPFVDSLGHRACLVPPPREKRYLSPAEKKSLTDASLPSSNSTYDPAVYYWRGICFASLICFEFGDISTRNALRMRADLLTVSSWNTDWRYFTAVQESTTRDNYCITVCVNTGQFPGTQIARPTTSDRAIAASVHGSRDATVVTRDIDMLPVVVARASLRRPSRAAGFLEPNDDINLEHYKALPPSL